MRAKRIALLVVLVLSASVLLSCGQTQSQTASQRAQLRVVLYPFIPEFVYAADTVKRMFEKENPDIELTVLDLTANYYSPSPDDDPKTYIGNVKADVYELDSVFLRDFVEQHKIRPLPDDMLLPQDQLLKNAYAGSMLDGKRYGSAHWACGNFLFFTKDTAPPKMPANLKELADDMGTTPDQRMLVDLRGRLTLGEFYLGAAYAKYKDWATVQGHLQTAEQPLKDDLGTILKMCPKGNCRDQIFHEDTGIYGQEFALKRSKSLIGYSELLHSVLTEASFNGTLTDADLRVGALPLDDSGAVPISWVDSFVLRNDCNDGDDCFKAASKFIKFMQRDDAYMKMLLPTRPSFLNYPDPKGPDPTPAYLLPAKSTLYTNIDLLKFAHLYTDLKSIIEGAAVPTDKGLNDRLRTVSKDVDTYLKTVVQN
jgi:thiamine pyridinylase